MSKTKKFIVVMALIVLIILELLCFVGCTKETYGEFYTLEEAYEQGLISRDDLQNIAYYHNGVVIEGFTPKPLEPQELSKKTAKKICKDAGKKFDDTYYDDFGIAYYGTYNGAVAIRMYGYEYGAAVMGGESVDGVWFSYGSSLKIKIWKEKGE